MACKELKEVIIAANEVCLQLAKGIRLGAYENVAALLGDIQQDQELQDKLLVAIDGINALPEEIVSLGFGDYLTLGRLQISYMGKFVAVLRAAKPGTLKAKKAATTK